MPVKANANQRIPINDNGHEITIDIGRYYSIRRLDQHPSNLGRHTHAKRQDCAGVMIYRYIPGNTFDREIACLRCGISLTIPKKVNDYVNLYEFCNDNFGSTRTP